MTVNPRNALVKKGTFMRRYRSWKAAPALFASLAAALVVTAATARADLIYVNGTTGNDAWNGLCEEWDGGTCGPKKTIQAGIDVASNGDTVIVADGTYVGANNTNVIFNGKAITLRSKNGPADCIVDLQNTSVPAFRLISGEGPNTVLDGFTVMKCSGC
jgi:hypothetical protein